MEITINTDHAAVFIITLISCLISFGGAALLLRAASQPDAGGDMGDDMGPDDKRPFMFAASVGLFVIGIIHVWLTAVWCYQTYGWMG